MSAEISPQAALSSTLSSAFPLALLSRLSIVAPADIAGVLPDQVFAALPPAETVVFMVDDDASDTAQCSERYGIDLEDCANTIVIRYKKAGAEHYAAIVSLGSRRLDVNGAVKAHLGAQRLSFAKREDAVSHTGMEFGGITAFGLPADWRVLVDAAVLERAHIVMGAGIRQAKLLLPPSVLIGLPVAEVASLTLPA